MTLTSDLWFRTAPPGFVALQQWLVGTWHDVLAADHDGLSVAGLEVRARA